MEREVLQGSCGELAKEGAWEPGCEGTEEDPRQAGSSLSGGQALRTSAEPTGHTSPLTGRLRSGQVWAHPIPYLRALTRDYQDQQVTKQKRKECGMKEKRRLSGCLMANTAKKPKPTNQTLKTRRTPWCKVMPQSSQFERCPLFGCGTYTDREFCHCVSVQTPPQSC